CFFSIAKLNKPAQLEQLDIRCKTTILIVPILQIQKGFSTYNKCSVRFPNDAALLLMNSKISCQGDVA
ncbi:MAG: hypothetical protein OEX19_09825, partial [Gammaproteobacteria bacterium]|nr:hypothetical protein [Gammaproteobacteria bacterium]